MSNHLDHKQDDTSFKSRGKLLLVSVLLIGTFTALALIEPPCRGLKPFNNLEELLYQVYINLDSECLLKMPVAELEEKWGIKILSDERLKPGQMSFQLRDSFDFAGKPCVSEKDAFFVEKKVDEEQGISELVISITDAYREKHGTLFPDGRYPKLLPEPKHDRVPIVFDYFGPGPGSPSPSENTSQGLSPYQGKPVEETPRMSREVADMVDATEQTADSKQKKPSSIEFPGVQGESSAEAPQWPQSLFVDVAAKPSDYNIFYNNNVYYWLNSSQTSMVYLYVIEEQITQIIITNRVHPDYKTFSFSGCEKISFSFSPASVFSYDRIFDITDLFRLNNTRSSHLFVDLKQS